MRTHRSGAAVNPSDQYVDRLLPAAPFRVSVDPSSAELSRVAGHSLKSQAMDRARAPGPKRGVG